MKVALQNTNNGRTVKTVTYVGQHCTTNPDQTQLKGIEKKQQKLFHQTTIHLNQSMFRAKLAAIM